MGIGLRAMQFHNDKDIRDDSRQSCLWKHSTDIKSKIWEKGLVPVTLTSSRRGFPSMRLNLRISVPYNPLSATHRTAKSDARTRGSSLTILQASRAQLELLRYRCSQRQHPVDSSKTPQSKQF